MRIAKAVSSTIEQVNSKTSNADNSVDFAMCALPACVSLLSWSHVLMDGKELDDKQYT